MDIYGRSKSAAPLPSQRKQSRWPHVVRRYGMLEITSKHEQKILRIVKLIISFAQFLLVCY
jgi:hypothetical protein